MTLVVLAHPHDEAAARLVQRWRPQGARLMLPRDLSHAGWRMHVGGRGEEWFVAEGERIKTLQLRGVLTRLPVVEPAMLPHLHPGDRDYIANEMTAFLVAWLAQLRCPVLNRPVASSMLGPSVTAERLPWLAARHDLRLWPRVSPVDAEAASAQPSMVTVSVVGDRWFGRAPTDAVEQARRLARALHTPLLTAQFALPPPALPTASANSADGMGAALLAAELLVDIDQPDIADAVLSLFQTADEKALP